MTQEQQLILTIKGAISELPPEQQEECKAAYAQLKQIIETGSPAVFAMALLGAEIQGGLHVED